MGERMWLTELRLRCRSHRAQCLIHCGAYPLGAITSLAVEPATKASLEVVIRSQQSRNNDEKRAGRTKCGMVGVRGFGLQPCGFAGTGGTYPLGPI